MNGRSKLYRDVQDETYRNTPTHADLTAKVNALKCMYNPIIIIIWNTNIHQQEQLHTAQLLQILNHEGFVCWLVA